MMASIPSPSLSEGAAGLHTALAARKLRIGYGGKTVVDDISLDIDKREIVCLLGGSGCGKSTLLRGLAGLSAPQAGSVSFLGEALHEPHPRAALVFQQPSLLPWLNVEGNVGFGLDFARQPKIERAARKARIREAIEAVGLGARAHAYPAQLSGGQAQRVALARALARQPELLFADEPFSALDAVTRSEMQELLVDLVHRWHTAALLVTHDIDEAILVADRILLMAGQPGHIVREWKVEIPRPRHEHSDALVALRYEIVAALKAGVTPAVPL